MGGLIDVMGMVLFKPVVGLVPSAFLSSLSKNLRISGLGVPAPVWLVRSFLILFGFLVAGLFFGFWSFLLGVVFFAVYLFFPFWRAGVVVEDLLKVLPSALLSAASSVQAGQTPEEVFVFLSDEAQPPLNGLFKQVVSLSSRERVDLGRGLERILGFYGRPELDRASNLLSVGLRCGADLHSVFNLVARDLLSVRELRREQVQLMVTLKYSLLLAVSFLIPSILAFSVLVSSLLGYSASNLVLAAQLSFIPLAIIFGAVLSFFCDFKPRLFFLYAPSLVLIQFLVFRGVLFLSL